MARKQKGEGKVVAPKTTGNTEMQEEQTETQSEVTDVKTDDSQLEIGANESAPADESTDNDAQEQSDSEEAPAETAPAPVVENQDAPSEETKVAEGQEQGSSEVAAAVSAAQEEPAPVEGEATPAELVIIDKDPIEDEPEDALDPQPEVTPVAGDTDAGAPAVDAEPEPVVLSGKAAILARLHSQGPAHLSGLRSMLIGYLDVMGNERRTTAEEQLLQQKLFRTAVFSLLKLRGPEFISALDELLVVIAAHKDFVFKEKYVFREIKNLPVSADERNALVNIITLLLTIAEPATRALALNQIDLGSALKGIRGEDEIRALIHEYVTRGL